MNPHALHDVRVRRSCRRDVRAEEDNIDEWVGEMDRRKVRILGNRLNAPGCWQSEGGLEGEGRRCRSTRHFNQLRLRADALAGFAARLNIIQALGGIESTNGDRQSTYPLVGPRSSRESPSMILRVWSGSSNTFSVPVGLFPTRTAVGASDRRLASHGWLHGGASVDAGVPLCIRRRHRLNVFGARWITVPNRSRSRRTCRTGTDAR